MDYEKLFTLLKNYDEITKDEEENLKTYFVVEKIKKRQKLIDKNKPCNKLFFVNSGLLRAFYTNDNALNEFKSKLPAYECLEFIEKK